MLHKSCFPATGRPLEHHRYLALRGNREQTDFATHFGVERFPVNTEGLNIEFASWLAHWIIVLSMKHSLVTINGTEGEDQADRQEVGPPG
jgi:hypothetical protein